MNRRKFLQTSSAFAGLGLSGCTRRIPILAPPGAPALPFYDAVGPIPPIRADLDRIFRITVCLRPFRATGPRIEAERVGEKLVVHNYGHGGSGWSLSWGSAEVVVTRLALQASDGHPPRDSPFSAAAHSASPPPSPPSACRPPRHPLRQRPAALRPLRPRHRLLDARLPHRPHLGRRAPRLRRRSWESMARASFAMYQSFLGLPGKPHRVRPTATASPTTDLVLPNARTHP